MSCNPHRVRVQQIVERRVTLDSRQITRINNNRPIVSVNNEVRKLLTNDERNIIRPTIEQMQLNVGTPGLKGKDGRDGQGGIPAIDFAYNESSRLVHIETGAGTYNKIRIEVSAAWNDGAVEVGFVGDTSALMEDSENDLSEVGSYEVTSDVHASAGQGVWLNITRGNATQGTGKLYLEFTPD